MTDQVAGLLMRSGGCHADFRMWSFGRGTCELCWRMRTRAPAV